LENIDTPDDKILLGNLDYYDGKSEMHTISTCVSQGSIVGPMYCKHELFCQSH